MTLARDPGDGALRFDRLAEILARPAVTTVLDLLDRDGETARIVGGAVRNPLIGLEPGDLDVATTALPQVVLDRAEAAGLKAVPTGIEHGTVTLIVDGVPVEVTTLREDVDTDGRHAVVRFGRDFAHDAARRDFTMNALYAGRDGIVVDLVGGLADLAARRVRFIGDADARIREDYLRVLRLFRFHAAYGEGPLDPAALAAAIRGRTGLARLSAERVRAELLKLLSARGAVHAAHAMADAGLLDRLLGGAVDRGALAGLGAADPVLRLAALAVFTVEDAERLAEVLRLSRAEAGRLEAIARLLAIFHGRLSALTPADMRALAYRHGSTALGDACRIEAARTRLVLAPASATVLADPVPPLPWAGRDLISRGIAPGPRIGAILAEAERAWIAADFPVEPQVLGAILDAALAKGSDTTVDRLPFGPATD